MPKNNHKYFHKKKYRKNFIRTLTRGNFTKFFNYSDTNIIIPSTITSIEAGLFYNNTTLKSVTFEDSDTEIFLGEKCFGNADGCKTQLTHVIINRKISPQSKSCFEGCSALYFVIISNVVTVLGERWFENCTALKSIIIPKYVTEIKSRCFMDCTGLTKIIIPSSVNKIEDSFMRCRRVTDIIFEESSKDIMLTKSFSQCSSLKIIEINRPITRLPKHCFSHCTSLKSFTIPDSVQKISKYCFNYCTSLGSNDGGIGISLVSGNVNTLIVS